MFEKRPPTQQIDRYAGPYERWVFSEELGKPFAFPAISDDTSVYFTALLEGSQHLPDDPDLVTRKPPLWNPLNRSRAVTPFAFHDATANRPRSSKPPDKEIARLLSAVREGQVDSILRPRFRVNFPIAPDAWTPTYHPDCNMEDWVVPDTPPKAIVAVIDDGIPFAHRAFLDAQGRTRMSHVWLQSARADDHGAVPFGRELMNGNINALRGEAGSNEDLIYRRAGAIDPELPELGHHLRRQATHGAHIAGMCAGNDTRLSSHPMGDGVQIIAVQLPNTIAWDTSGFGKEMYMLSALHYVFNRARAIASKYATDPDNPEELPLIVNFSYGWSASRHDGQSEMELAIEELLSERQTLQPDSAVVMPTGNNFDSKMHGQITSTNMDSGSYAFGWQVLPDDRTSSYLEIWLPQNMDPDKYSVTVSPPAGHVLSAGGDLEISADQSLDDDAAGSGDPRRFTELEMGGQNIGQLSADQHRGNRWRVMLALVPTVNVRGQHRRAPAGLWKIEIKQNAGAALGDEQQINVWVQRDDDPASLRTGGRQSRLVDIQGPPPPAKHPLRDYSEHIGFLRGYGSTNGVASSPSVTRVAGYVDSVKRPCTYSGSGGIVRNADESTSTWGVSTTLTAMADQSRMHAGTLSIGVRSGSGARLSGTSGAAPAASRQMVLNAAAGGAPMDHFEGQLTLVHPEVDGPVTKIKHPARTGTHTMPPVGKNRQERP